MCDLINKTCTSCNHKIHTYTIASPLRLTLCMYINYITYIFLNYVSSNYVASVIASY